MVPVPRRYSARPTRPATATPARPQTAATKPNTPALRWGTVSHAGNSPDARDQDMEGNALTTPARGGGRPLRRPATALAGSRGGVEGLAARLLKGGEVG